MGELAHGYGFLSVFACAVTLRWMEMKSATPGAVPELPLIAIDRASRFEAAVNPNTAPLFLVELLLQFTDQLEQIGELVIVIIVGALLTPATFAGRNIADLLLLFFIIRPLSILVGLVRTPLSGVEKGLIGWFGIRGIGSLYYLAYTVQHGLPESRMLAVANTVLASIAISVAIHGITVTPLMNWYGRRQQANST
jgi:NhaP-type Na+/H+ or K+/H+ antiporter